MSHLHLNSKNKQILLAVFFLFICILFWGTPFFIWIPLAFGLGLLILLKGFSDPSFFCLVFFTFCLFRVQEFFPQLATFQLPMISALLGVLSLLYNIALHKTEPYWQKQMTYFMLFFLQVTVGIILAYDFNAAYYDWTNLFGKIPIIFFLIVWSLHSKKDFKLLITITIIAGTLISIVTLYNKQNDIGLILGTRASVLAGAQSYLSDPNDLAFTMLIPLSFACSLFFSKESPLNTRLLGLGSLIIITSAIIATQSRGGLLGLVGVFLYFLSRRIKSKLPIALVGAALFIFFYFIGGASQRDTWDGNELDESSSGRIHAWKAAVNMAIHHPILGVGLGGFIPNFDKYAIGKGNTQITAHSSWFLVLGESGFIGLFLFVTCVYLAIKTTYLCIQNLEALDVKEYPQKTFYLIFSYGLLSCFIGFCISGSFLSQGFTWPIYILLALSISLAHSYDEVFSNHKHTMLGKG